ncbi:hypothetical protein JQM69_08745 [Faecalicatena contorta]|uniref:hypothetical protein n=1 Tax=Faecalicatena contorta TaxID=39482 RepID=UPI001F414DFA|nr:hypothetical protein [Faecalicatena contorta]MCF2680777.1 hypothetical protein [Faecalicatena contorta]
MKKRWIVPLCLALVAGVTGLLSTAEETQKVQKISAAEPRMDNLGCETMELNPLHEEEDPNILKTVEDYYGEQKEKSDFIESYDNVHVYTKLGKYRGSYVAFVKYEMKIKDIYTKVPGLGTLYLIPDETGEGFKVDAEAKKSQIRDYVARISTHEDVQALLQEAGREYTEAVQSDALLQEALLDLKNAYENSTGS